MESMWTPRDREVKLKDIAKFQHYIEEKYLQKFKNYKEFHHFSCEKGDTFWRELFNFYQISYRGKLSPECLDWSFDSYQWFPETKLNFAENLLKKGRNKKVAIDFYHESGANIKITYEKLRYSVSTFQEELKSYFEEGDVLAAYMPNIPETVVAMLAATGLGGVFTSTSCDFGVEGVVERFGQSKPKVLVAASAYQYGGKLIDLRERIDQIKKLVPSIEKVIVVDFLGTKQDHAHIRWEEMTHSTDEITYVDRRFDDPLYIMYSSGTTGKPKCIVHGVGGVLLQHVKEHGLHVGMSEDKNIFFFTTCGWMMWNWLVSGLFFGGTITLYEGSPGYPSMTDFLKIINRGSINFFGTSPKFLRALENSGQEIPGPFPKLEGVMSTGAPLLLDQFEFIHNKIKKTHIASISGGTDIIGCFMLGAPSLPIYSGEIQCLGLGMDVDCWDESGQSIKDQEGELVCKKSFPSRPIYFLDDDSGEKIHKAYFERFPGVWHHGDFITITERGGVVVHGRSDATLNPGGVRIGTAEIYQQTELIDYIDDSICVGRPCDGDVEVVLFVKLKQGQELSSDRIDEIKNIIKSQTSPRHVPAEIKSVSDIPYTRSGKKMELAVTRILQDKEITNLEAVSNPECLEFFK